MPDKAKFVSELCRVLRPGGRLILVAWTHRDLEEGEKELKKKEQKLLRRISQVLLHSLSILFVRCSRTAQRLRSDRNVLMARSGSRACLELCFSGLLSPALVLGE